MAAKDELLKKISKEDADDLVKGIKQLKAAGQLENLAEQAGVSSGVLGEIADKGTKALKKVGEGLSALQEGVNALRGQTELEQIGAKAAQGGEVPPTVPSAFKTETLGKETGYTLQPPVGGPLAPTSQSRALQKTQENLNFYPSEAIDAVTGAPMSKETAVVPFGQVMERPTAAQTEVAGAAAQAKPGAPGAGVSELTPEAMTPRAAGYRTEAERAADLGLSLDMNVAPEAKKAAKYGLGLGATGGAAWFGYNLLSNEQKQQATPTLSTANITTPDELKKAVDTAGGQQAIEPDKQEQINNMTDQLKATELTLAQAFEKEADTARKDLVKRQANLELLQAMDTIAHGLASAIGSAALLNRGSPYAVDFSKGPQVDWNTQFDRLQKQFDGQLAAIEKKYKIAEHRQQQEELARYRQAKLGIEQQKVEAEQAKAAGKTAQAEQKKAETDQAKRDKLTAETTGILEKISAPDATTAQLSAQAGLLTQKAKLLLGDEGFNAVKAEAAKIANENTGVFEKAWKSFTEGIGLADSKESKTEYRRRISALAEAMGKRLESGVPAPAATLVDMVAPDGRALRVPAERVTELEAKGARRK